MGKHKGSDTRLQAELAECRRRVAELEGLKHEWEQATAAQKKTQNELNAIIESTADGILVIDDGGRVLHTNSRFQEMWRIPADLVASRDDQALLDSVLEQLVDPQAFLAKVQALYQSTDQDWDTLAFKDGRFFERFSCPLLQEGRMAGRLWSFRDVTRQKRMEQALRESEERFRMLSDKSPLGMSLIDEQGRYEYVNDAFVQMFGYELSQIPTGREWFRLAYPDADYRRMVRETWKEDLGRYPELEMRPRTFDVVCKGGGIKTILFRPVTLPSRKQFILYDDVTARKQAEEALKQSEEKFRFLAEKMVDIVWTTDEGFHTTYVSPSIEKILGFTPEERKRHSLEQMLTPESCRRVQQRFEEEMRREAAGDADPDRSLIIELEYYRKDGSTLWMENTVKGIRDAEGALIGLFGVSRDIAERKRAEAALRESEEKYRILVENAGEAIFVAQGGFLRFVNARTAQIIGHSKEELTSRPFIEFIHPDDRPMVLDRHLKRQQGVEVPNRYPFRILHRCGETLWVELNVVAIEWQGNPATLNFLLDITERVRADAERQRLEAQLRQAQKMEAVGRLAGGVAHDFNNKLTAILGYADLALASIEPDSPLRAGLVEIQKAGMRAADLVRQLLGFARRQAVSPQALDLNETVEDLLKMLRRLIGEDIHLTWSPGPDLWTVMVDPSQIDQILANLVVNARDAIGGSGKISIETANVVLDEAFCVEHAGSLPGEYVILAVADDGCGMDEKVLEHLFEPFFTTKEIGKGTGLGLATVYGIVKQNDGFIQVSSQPEQGTTMSIYLPRLGSVAASTHCGEGVPVEGGSETILLVEDEPEVLALSRIVLEDLGYRVLSAGTPEEAIRLSGEHRGRIHLLLTDVIMPGMNGRELFHLLRSPRPELRCLYMSGYTADVIDHEGVLEPGVQFLQKPFSRDILARRVREALGRGTGAQRG
jgi:PAS domain S-box-containing protein